MVKSTSSIKLNSDMKKALMTKAQFEALADERRKVRGGSGFDEFGRHFSSGIVNEGMWTYPAYPNYFILGKNDGLQGTSKTFYPLVNVNGVIHRLDKNVANQYKIDLPVAPTVTHADASNSGMVLNGRNHIDTAGWTNMTLVDGKLRVINTGTWVRGKQSFATVIGQEYILEIDYTGNTTGSNAYIRVGSTIDGYDIINNGYAFTDLGRKLIKFTAISTTTYLHFISAGNTDTTYTEWTNIAMFPSYEISRSDLVFLETWHEDITEKDFVYPFGDVQFQDSATQLFGMDITPINAAFTGKDTYSLYGNWQSPDALIGKGYVWSTMTEANKIAFVSDPENNCYRDGDNIIQVRFRVRVVQGLDDEWGEGDYGIYTQDNKYFGHKPGFAIQSKGKDISIASDLAVTADYWGIQSIPPVDEETLLGNGHFAIRDYPSITACTYGGATAFIAPIALVHRRNQGGYHPKFNPNGSARMNRPTLDGVSYWYESNANKGYSIADFFNQTTATEGGIAHLGGAISANNSGRPDGLFYDQIHESDIIDLRNSSKKISDLKRLLEKEVNRAIAGKTRGIEGEIVSELVLKGTATSVAYTGAAGTYLNVVTDLGIPASTFSKLVLGTNVNYICIVSGIPYWIGQSQSGYFTLSKIGCGIVDNTDTTLDITDLNFEVYKSYPSTRKKSNTITHCDIIGNPANYYRGQTYITKGTKQVVTTAIGDVVQFKNASANVVLTGSIDATASTSVVGVGTLFTTELNVGDSILVSGEERVVATIIDDLNLTVTVAFTDTLNDTSPEQVGKGTGTIGNFYKALTTQTDVDLNQELFATDTTNWQDLGADWDGPDSWRTGISGTPLLIGENGEDYVGTTMALSQVKLTKKFSGSLTIFTSSDNGITWAKAIDTGDTNANTPFFGYTVGQHFLYMIFYETYTNLTENASNSEVLEIGDVETINRQSILFGNTLLPSLINKVGVGTSYIDHKTKLDKYLLDLTNKLSTVLLPETLAGESDPWNSIVPAVKILPYITKENNKAYLQIIFKEMKYNVGWGDDNKFNIVVDGVTTTIDDNGDAILIGQKRIELPYFIGDKK